MLRAMICSLVGVALVAFVGQAAEKKAKPAEHHFRGHIVTKECATAQEHGKLEVEHKGKAASKEEQKTFGIGQHTKWVDADGKDDPEGCASPKFEKGTHVTVTYIDIKGKDGKEHQVAVKVQAHAEKPAPK